MQAVDRRRFIGGSDVAAILGISPWRTPLDVYLEKVDPRPEPTDPQRQRVLERGKRLEPYVLDMLAEETGLVVVARNQRYIDPEHAFLAAEIDAEAETGENIEIKTVSPFKAHEWGAEDSDEIPVWYTAQAMHGLMVTGREVCVFGVLIGADEFRTYRVERDDEVITALRERLVEFWARVQRREPPEPTTAADVLALFDKDTGRAVEASAEIIQAYNELRAVETEAKALKARADALKEQIQLYMRDAAVLTIDGRQVCTWKSQSCRRFDQRAFQAAHPELFETFKRATETRVFRVN